ncbi:MAG: arginine--tRNA ligase [Patescibacteria group bacterium]|jgi:arginyl-tRNA synthetase|nr:arginine--tRNA ligase [Patescibacteria group bacterium]
MTLIIDAVEQAVVNLFGVKPNSIDLTRPDSKFGDFATNIAMQIAKEIGQNPKEIALKITNYINNQNYEWLRLIDIAGPGFINIYISDNYIIKSLTETPERVYQDKIIVAEYSDPNAFKALHAGHLYTTLVGDSITRILETVGAKIIRLNYGGDVGLHAAKAMWGIISNLGGEHPGKLNDIKPILRPVWVSERYTEGNTAYESSDNIKQEINEINQRIYDIHTQNDTQSDFAKIYWACRDWSYDGFKKLYQDLQVKPFDEFIPESKVTPLGVEIVNKGLKQGVFEQSDGAVVYSEQKSGLHTRVFITSKGLPVYEAKELGLAIYKWKKYHFEKSLIITANDIAEYMKVLLSAASNFYPQATERTTHITHGMIKFAGGQKMSSRTGNVLMAKDILESAIRANIESSGKDNKEVAIGAIKYTFLKQRIGDNISFDPKESISLNGNSGPYLQYAHARARNILVKVARIANNLPDDIVLDEQERLLAVKLGEYKDAIERSAQELMPHYICTYLYDLAQTFNRFYENSKVVGSEREQIRAYLVNCYANTLKNGLNLLGISAPNKM